MSVRVDDDFDGGNIRVLDAGDPRSIELALAPDNASDFMQWFCFRVRGAERVPCAFHIVNAGEATYASGFEGYQAVASYDRQRWFRVPTEYDGDALTVRHTPDRGSIYYAYFAPYSFRRTESLMRWAASTGQARLERLGESVDGHPMNLLALGEGDERRIWIIARQHPGEAMAAWFMEGAILRLCDDRDEVARDLLDRATIYLVPTMNPDGGARGNHRTNAAGLDLNRQWSRPDRGASPEVWLVRRAIGETGCDLFLDVHGDEDIPYVFAAGCEGNPKYTRRIASLEDTFEDRLAAIDPDFQREHGYDPDTPGKKNLALAANWVGQRFDCLSLTLEMPFSDNANRPDAVFGWSPERCHGFARSTLEAARDCLDVLR